MRVWIGIMASLIQRANLRESWLTTFPSNNWCLKALNRVLLYLVLWDAVVCQPNEPNSAEGVDDLRCQLTLDVVADVFWGLGQVEFSQVNNGDRKRHFATKCLSNCGL